MGYTATTYLGPWFYDAHLQSHKNWSEITTQMFNKQTNNKLFFFHFFNQQSLLYIPSVDDSAKTSDPGAAFLPAFGNQCISVGKTSSGSLQSGLFSLFKRFHLRTWWSSPHENTSSGVVHPTELTSSLCFASFWRKVLRRIVSAKRRCVIWWCYIMKKILFIMADQM